MSPTSELGSFGSRIDVAQGKVDDGAGPGDPSQFQLVWTAANGTCLRTNATSCESNVSASWSASISATGLPAQNSGTLFTATDYCRCWISRRRRHPARAERSPEVTSLTTASARDQRADAFLRVQ